MALETFPNVADELARIVAHTTCQHCGKLFSETPCDLADHAEAFEALLAHREAKG